MKTFRFLIVLLAIAVGFAGLNADAKVKKRKTTRRAAKAKVVEPAPTNYDYVQGTYVEDQIFEMSKYPPEYPGGTEKGVQGTVVLQFVVEKDGSISNVKVLRSVDKALDAEAVRVVKQMKRFVPGYNEDHAAVRVLYTLPVSFKLH